VAGEWNPVVDVDDVTDLSGIGVEGGRVIHGLVRVADDPSESVKRHPVELLSALVTHHQILKISAGFEADDFEGVGSVLEFIPDFVTAQTQTALLLVPFDSKRAGCSDG
jgi:hypothetical protein